MFVSSRHSTHPTPVSKASSQSTFSLDLWSIKSRFFFKTQMCIFRRATCEEKLTGHVRPIREVLVCAITFWGIFLSCQIKDYYTELLIWWTKLRRRWHIGNDSPDSLVRLYINMVVCTVWLGESSPQWHHDCVLDLKSAKFRHEAELVDVTNVCQSVTGTIVSMTTAHCLWCQFKPSPWKRDVPRCSVTPLRWNICGSLG